MFEVPETGINRLQSGQKRLYARVAESGRSAALSTHSGHSPGPKSRLSRVAETGAASFISFGPAHPTALDSPPGFRTAFWADVPYTKTCRWADASALFWSLRNKRRWDVLNRFASALRATRMSGFMFGEMFGMLEKLAALLAAVLVSRHGASQWRKPEAPTEYVTPWRPVPS